MFSIEFHSLVKISMLFGSLTTLNTQRVVRTRKIHTQKNKKKTDTYRPLGDPLVDPSDPLDLPSLDRHLVDRHTDHHDHGRREDHDLKPPINQ